MLILCFNYLPLICFFSRKSAFQNADVCQRLPLNAYLGASHGLYDLFLLSRWFFNMYLASIVEKRIFVHPTHQDGSPQVSYHSLLAITYLNHIHITSEKSDFCINGLYIMMFQFKKYPFLPRSVCLPVALYNEVRQGFWLGQIWIEGTFGSY